MVIIYFDNGGPPFNPIEERILRDWIDEVRILEEGGIIQEFIARTAVYRIIPLLESEIIATSEQRIEALELITNAIIL